MSNFYNLIPVYNAHFFSLRELELNYVELMLSIIG